jgi:protein phosphatase
MLAPESGLFVVADGMGGHAAGEVASSMAVQIIGRALRGVRGRSDDEVAHLIREAIRDANGQIFQRTIDEADKRGMGTTATALLLNGAHYLIGQVGDSRAYMLRGAHLDQITKDHSYVQEQVDAGYLTPEQARTHPYSNVITRCVGANSDVAPDIYMGALRTGDTFLLASDGLTGMLEDPDLLAILKTGRPPAELVDVLIADANRRGGLDNITAILVRIDSVGVESDGRQTAAVAQT